MPEDDLTPPPLQEPDPTRTALAVGLPSLAGLAALWLLMRGRMPPRPPIVQAEALGASLLRPFLGRRGAIGGAEDPLGELAAEEARRRASRAAIEVARKERQAALKAQYEQAAREAEVAGAPVGQGEIDFTRTGRAGVGQGSAPFAEVSPRTGGEESVRPPGRDRVWVAPDDRRAAELRRAADILTTQEAPAPEWYARLFNQDIPEPTRFSNMMSDLRPLSSLSFQEIRQRLAANRIGSLEQAQLTQPGRILEILGMEARPIVSGARLSTGLGEGEEIIASRNVGSSPYAVVTIGAPGRERYLLVQERHAGARLFEPEDWVQILEGGPPEYLASLARQMEQERMGFTAAEAVTPPAMRGARRQREIPQRVRNLMADAAAEFGEDVRIEQTYGRRGSPAAFRSISLDEARQLRRGDEMWLESRDGTMRTVRVSGRVRTWVRDPNRLEIPWRYGLQEHGTARASDFERGDYYAIHTAANERLHELLQQAVTPPTRTAWAGLTRRRAPITSYEDASQALGTRDQRLVRPSTWLEWGDADSVLVRQHSNRIIRYRPDGMIELQKHPHVRIDVMNRFLPAGWQLTKRRPSIGAPPQEPITVWELRYHNQRILEVRDSAVFHPINDRPTGEVMAMEDLPFAERQRISREMGEAMPHSQGPPELREMRPLGVSGSMPDEGVTPSRQQAAEEIRQQVRRDLPGHFGLAPPGGRDRSMEPIPVAGRPAFPARLQTLEHFIGYLSGQSGLNRGQVSRFLLRHDLSDVGRLRGLSADESQQLIRRLTEMRVF